MDSDDRVRRNLLPRLVVSEVERYERTFGGDSREEEGRDLLGGDSVFDECRELSLRGGREDDHGEGRRAGDGGQGELGGSVLSCRDLSERKQKA